MIDLDDIHRATGSGDGDAETQQEAATHKLTGAVAEGLNDSADNDEEGSREHAYATTKTINDGAHEGQSDNAANLVHGRDNPGPDTIILDTISFPESRILQEIIDKRTIVTVHCAAEEADSGEGVDENLSRGPGVGRLLNHRLIEGFIASNNLGVDNLGLWSTCN